MKLRKLAEMLKMSKEGVGLILHDDLTKRKLHFIPELKRSSSKSTATDERRPNCPKTQQSARR